MNKVLYLFQNKWEYMSPVAQVTRMLCFVAAYLTLAQVTPNLGNLGQTGFLIF